MVRIFAGLRSIVFAAAFLWGWGWLALMLRRFDRAPLASWTIAPGEVLFVLGGAVAAWCIGAFVVRGRGTPALFDPPRRLVAVGPYVYVRNPMYIGGAL